MEKKIHEISINRLLVNAILIKINKKVNQSITKNEIINFEKKHGKIPNNATIIFATGWQKHLQKKYYFEKNPGLSINAANYLVSKKINLVGTDSPPMFVGSSKSLELFLQ